MRNRSQAIIAVPIILVLISLLGIGFVHATLQLHKEALIYDKQQTPFATPQLLPTYTPTPLPVNTNLSFPILDIPPALETQGNQLINAVTKEDVQLVGASISSLEYSCQGNGHFAVSDFMTMRSWGMNIVRIPLSSQLFLNSQGVCPTYTQTLLQIINNATQSGLYVDITLQWNAPFGDNTSMGGSQYPLPDSTKDGAFWEKIAHLFRTNSNVFFDLFGEPHDVSFDQWFYGGRITIGNNNDYRNLTIPQLVHGTYNAIGMYNLAAKVRAISPNIIIISGTDWGFDLEQLNNPQFAFPENNLLFATHLWDHSNEQPDSWNKAFWQIQSRLPVIVTEMGQYDCKNTYVSQVIPALNEKNISWIGWSWGVGNCLNNSNLLASWDGTPNSPYSAYLRQQILDTVDQQK